MKKSIIASALGMSSLLLGGCFTDSSPTVQNSVNNPFDPLLYDLPSSMTGENATNGLARTTTAGVDSNQKIWEAYKPVGAYIGLANKAKNSVRELIAHIDAANLPSTWEGDKDGQHIVVKTLDTTIESFTQKFVKITVSQNSKTILNLGYWKNARSQLAGSVQFKDLNNNNYLWVRFNNQNEELLGKRMNVVFRSGAALAQSNDPAAVQVVAVKKDEKIFVGGLSVHPQFSDNYLPSGAAVYAFQLAGNSTTDRSVLRVGFGPKDSVNKENIFKKYSLDQVFIRAGQNALSKDTGTVEESFMWSYDNQTPLGVGNFVTSAAYQPKSSILSLSESQFRDLMTLNKPFFFNSAFSNPELINFYISTHLPAQVFFQKGGNFLGVKGQATVESSGVTEDDLANSPLVLEPTGASFSDLSSQTEL